MKYEIKRSRRNGQYRAYVIGGNGRTIFTSEQYMTCAKAVKAIRLLDDTAPIDVFDMKGEWTRTIQPEKEDVYL